jgi:hypothetical protein
MNSFIGLVPHALKFQQIQFDMDVLTYMKVGINLHDSQYVGPIFLIAKSNAQI